MHGWKGFLGILNRFVKGVYVGWLHGYCSKISEWCLLRDNLKIDVYDTQSSTVFHTHRYRTISLPYHLPFNEYTAFPRSNTYNFPTRKAVLLINLSKNLNYRVYQFSFTSFDRGPSSCATLYNLFSTYTTRTARIFTGSIYLEHRNSPIHIDRDDTVSYG